MFDRRAVSEVMGEMLLLAMVIILVGVVSANMSELLPVFKTPVYADFIAKENAGNITIIHEGGEPLYLNSTRLLVEKTSSLEILNSTLLREELVGNNNSYWEFGEYYSFNTSGVILIKIVYEEEVLSRMYMGE